ncbi:phage head-tail connector protein [Geomicrobium sediminis]|uniref:Phage gp6-like head-tail connector protein n=1 Tax=Geomicrobium sediminis TaxID=1347788 RepID=A0ABS2P7S4_9BACL|nr:phage head-tail connector protein [Geomicrobium sediminis]MBM7631105.1 hypothetical protein [Geomicrobium sediminis]
MSNQKKIIKQLLEIDDELMDDVIEYYIESARQRLMNACYRDDFPLQLNHIVTEMVFQKLDNGSTPGVTSVRRGDTSTSFDSSDAFHRVMERYSEEIAMFRKVRSGC